MKEKNKKRDPMPPPDATPEEIGEFWDTHDLTDYWDDTHEVEFQVDLKPDRNQDQPEETKPVLSATIDEASNTALDTVTDLALDTTIPAPIRRNVLKALDRLGSALIDIPVGALERRSAEKRSESEERIKITEVVNAQIIEQIKVDPEFPQRATNTFAKKILREQYNLENILGFATHILKGKQYDNSKDSQADNESEKTIDDDWFNIFEKEASQKSTEDMQRRFGHILAGEIRQLGSYSIKAVKTLGELDPEAATLFKKLCSTCIAFENLTEGCVLDARVLHLGKEDHKQKSDVGRYNLSSYQEDVLIEYGLIRLIEEHSLYPYNLCIQSLNNPMPQSFRHQGRDWFFDPFDPIQEFRFPGIALSRVGRELFRIVDQEPMPEYTETLKKFFADQKLQMVEVPIQRSSKE